MHITLVEDDHLQAEWLESRLDAAFRGVVIKRLNTESDFYEWLNELENNDEVNPDLFIIDVMLRWADPSPTIAEPPPDVVDNGFYRAGLRCKDQVMANERTRDVPIILYTVLEELDLEKALENRPSGVTHLRKDSSAEPLIRMIRKIVGSKR
jgi:CheY-like chemotaxis protein